MSSSVPGAGRPKRSRGLAAFGLVCLIVGVSGLAALFVAVYGDAPANDVWSVRLGLAGSLLASAAAQLLVLVGGWALWRGLRRR
jgi:hypothetical protein